MRTAGGLSKNTSQNKLSNIRDNSSMSAWRSAVN